MLDTSVAIAWMFADQAGGTSPLLLELALAAPPHAPRLLWYEFANVVVAAERRGRLAAGGAERALGLLQRIGPVLDPRPEADAAPGWTALAQRHGLTVYDASYLALAVHLALPLATRDKALAAAARAEGLTVWG